VRQHRHAHRNAGQAAQHERQQQAQVEPAADREYRQQLPHQCTEYRQRGGQPRIQRPGPERHGHHAEGKAGQALHEPCHDRAQRDHQIHRLHPRFPLLGDR